VKHYLTQDQEAARIGVSKRSLQRRIKSDGYPYVVIGNVKRFDPDASDAHIAQRTAEVREAEKAA
jgi:hypothetical protein